MQKDVECISGILKGRWRVLKTGIRCEGVEAVNKILLTCCALHNWLLDIAGLDNSWDGLGVSPASDWEGEMGDHDFEGLPEPMAQLTAELDPRTYDVSELVEHFAIQWIRNQNKWPVTRGAAPLD